MEKQKYTQIQGKKIAERETQLSAQEEQLKQAIAFQEWQMYVKNHELFLREMEVILKQFEAIKDFKASEHVDERVMYNEIHRYLLTNLHTYVKEQAGKSADSGDTEQSK